MFEIAGHCSVASVGYEPYPDFCNHYQIIGHSYHNCRSKRDEDNEGKKDNYTDPPTTGDKNKSANWVRKDTTSTPKDNQPAKDNVFHPPATNDTTNQNSMTENYVIMGDRHVHFDPMPVYTSTSGAMQIVTYENPSTSWKPTPHREENSPTPIRTHDVYPQLERPQNCTDGLTTTNSFDDLASHHECSGAENEEPNFDKGAIENYSNDTMDLMENDPPSPTKRGRGRHKKTENKI